MSRFLLSIVYIWKITDTTTPYLETRLETYNNINKEDQIIGIQL